MKKKQKLYVHSTARNKSSALARLLVETETRLASAQEELFQLRDKVERPVPMILHCPECRARHIDEGEFAIRPHHTHACQACGFVWRPAVIETVGMRFLPGLGFKNHP
jgi:predicted Zn-ribbon and HTH transcriptional regulator